MSIAEQTNPSTEALVVTVAQGLLRGMPSEDPSIATFSGIPFAAPPVGELRWRPPAEPASWEGIRDASGFGPECLQSRAPGGGVFYENLIKGLGLGEPATSVALEAARKAPTPDESEDCLYLNVRTGNLGGSEPKPVMVWIHGGAHQNGSGIKEIYQSNALIERGIVLVTINYRLGPFGYLAHPALSAESEHGVSGNYGLLDQVAALEWVKENINAFGGNPDNVTIFGESAGSHSVSELMATPFAKGLFHKAIMESGVASRFMNKLKEKNNGLPSAEESGTFFFAQNGLADAQATADEIRAIPGEAIIKGIVDYPIYRMAFLPVADGYVQPDLIGQTIIDHKVHDVPILVGYNGDEGSLFYPIYNTPTLFKFGWSKEPKERLEEIKAFYGPVADDIVAAYELTEGEDWQAREALMLGDDYFGVHTRLLAKEQAKRGSPVYLYQFTRVPQSPLQTSGAYHASEIAFVFDSHGPGLADGDADRALTKAMGDYWTNFAKSGDPNGEGLPRWERHVAARDNWQILDHEIKEVTELRKQALDAHEAKLREILDTSR